MDSQPVRLARTAFWTSRPFRHPSSDISLGQIADSGEGHIYLFRILSGAAGEIRIFAGLELERSYVDAVLGRSVDKALEAMEPGTRPVLAVIEGGRRIFSSGTFTGRAEAKTAVGALFPLWEVAAGYSGTTVEAMARSQFELNLLLASLALAGLGLGTFFTLGTAARESRLAQMKSGFVSNVSHEMKTPLALIQMYAEMLESGRVSGPEKSAEYHRIIHRESRRLAGLIENVLDFARLENGAAKFRFEVVDVGLLVDEVVSGFEQQFLEMGFRFTLMIGENLTPVLADRAALSQALVNLIDNAIKYSGEQKEIDIAVRPNGGGVEVTVTDRGIGIAKSEQEKIFDKFYRVGDPLVHATRGAGLGLSLTLQIVKAHRGRIEVQSAPGQGSKFAVLLPAATAPGNS